MNRPDPRPQAILSRILVLTLLGLLGGCEKSYDLRGPAPAAGQTIRRQSKMEVANATVELEKEGRSFSTPGSMTAVSDEQIEILEVADRQIKKYRQRFDKNVLSTKFTSEGKTEESSESDPLQGETVLHQFQNGRWQRELFSPPPSPALSPALRSLEKFMREDGAKWKPSKPTIPKWPQTGIGGTTPAIPVKPASTATLAVQQQRALDHLDPLNWGDDLWPAGKVNVGEKWTVTGAALRGWMGANMLSTRGELQMTFKRVEELEGEQCAVVEISGQVKGRTLDSDDRETELEFGGSGTTWRSLATGLNRKEEFQGKMVLRGSILLQGEPVAMAIRGPMTMTSSDVPVKPLPLDLPFKTDSPASGGGGWRERLVSDQPVIGPLIILGLYALVRSISKDRKDGKQG